MKLTKRTLNHIREKMADLRNAHILLDSEKIGTIYWDFNYERGRFEAGGATNAGLICEYSQAYDPSEDFDSQLETFAEDATDYYRDTYKLKD